MAVHQLAQQKALGQCMEENHHHLDHQDQSKEEAKEGHHQDRLGQKHPLTNGTNINITSLRIKLRLLRLLLRLWLLLRLPGASTACACR